MSQIITFGVLRGPITCHAWNKDRTQIAFSLDTNEVHIYQRDGNDWKQTNKLVEHDLRVTGIDWAHETNRIVTCSVDQNAYVWNQTEGGKWNIDLVVLRIKRAACCVKWSPMENKFAVGTGASLICVCYFIEDSNWWRSKHIKNPIKSTVTALDWHPNNILLVAAFTDFSIRVFSAYISDIEDQPYSIIWRLKFNFQQLLSDFSSKPSSGWIHSISFSEDGAKVAWVGHDSSINIADVYPGNAVLTLKTKYLPFLVCTWISKNLLVVAGHDCVPLLYCYDSDGIRFVADLNKIQREQSGGMSGTLIEESIPTSASLNIHLYAHNKLQTSNPIINFMNEEIYITGSTSSFSARIYITSDIYLHSIHQNPITSINLYKGTKRDGKQFSTSGLDGQIVIWDLESFIKGLHIHQ